MKIAVHTDSKILMKIAVHTCTGSKVIKIFWFGVKVWVWQGCHFLAFRHEKQNAYNFNVHCPICIKLNMYHKSPVLNPFTCWNSAILIAPSTGDRKCKFFTICRVFNKLPLHIVSDFNLLSSLTWKIITSFHFWWTAWVWQAGYLPFAVHFNRHPNLQKQKVISRRCL